MSKLRFKISLSLDGFVAGPHQSVDNPLGIGGMRLHEWAVPLAVWRSVHGLQGGEVERELAGRRGVARQHRCDDHGPQYVRRSPRPLG